MRIEVITMFKLGDKVMLNPDKDEFTYGKGPVLYTDVGEINSICKDGDLYVNFPSHTYWRGKADDLVLYDEMKSNIVISDGDIYKYFHGGLHNPMLDDDTLDYVQTDINLCKQYDEIFNKEREEKDMNKVLKLYEERKLKEINDKYDKKVEDDYNAIEVVKQYNELVMNFESKLEELFNSLDNFDNGYLVTQCDSNCYKCTLSEDMIKNKLASKYFEEKQREIDEVTKLVSEADAQLSLSDDLTYQLEVLNRYGIIDKKTNKMTV